MDFDKVISVSAINQNLKKYFNDYDVDTIIKFVALLKVCRPPNTFF